jgi:type VI secretion system secreted protein VgrG
MFAQTDRPLQIKTPLGDDAIFVSGVKGREALSELFHYELDAYYQGTGGFKFDKLLGQPVTLTMTTELWADGVVSMRTVNGMVSGIAQLEFDKFLHLRIQVVPKLWTLTRTAQSRIFQQKSGPGDPHGGAGAADHPTAVDRHLQAARVLRAIPRDRFRFRQPPDGRGRHFLFLPAFGRRPHHGARRQPAGAPGPRPAALDPLRRGDRAARATTCAFMAGARSQNLRSGKYTLRDSHFENPDSNYESSKTIQPNVQVGTVTHELSVGGNSAWELYDYPGDYALRFDGVSSGGGDQPSNLQDAFADADRTVAIRMKQEAVASILIQGESNHEGLTPGYKFQLTNHFSDNGEFVLTGVEHEATQPIEPDRNTEPFTYQNRFTAIPAALPYAPQRITPQPVFRCLQTAIVVGPPGDEIFPDKYGRVKVQFAWDRDGQNNASSSCWVQVATFWAGKQWGAIHIPRIGQEVIVDFLEGDPDHPIIVGSVYNNDQMPPYTLPDNKTQSGIKSRSSQGGAAANYNEFRFEDKMGSEEILLHAEKDLTTEVEHDENRTVGNNRTTTIQVDETKTVHGKETITIDGNQSTEITQGNQTITLDQGNQTTELKMGNQSTTLDLGNQSTNVQLGSISMQAMQSITLTVGGNSITIDQSGITISGMMITISADTILQASGDAMTQIQGGIVMIN